MIRPIIKLPCTAQELETALHKVCDHEGLWDKTVKFDYFEKTISLEARCG